MPHSPRDGLNHVHVGELANGVMLMQASFGDHAFARHSHDCFAIGVTTEGVQRFRCKGRQHDSLPGDLVLFNPDDDHDGRAGTREGFRYAIWYVPDAIMSASLAADERGLHHRYFARPHVSDAHMAMEFRILSATMAALPWESLRTETLMSAFLRRLLNRHGETRSAPTTTGPHSGKAGLSSNNSLERVRDYIRSHYACDITVSDLALVAGVSRVHLTRAFSAAYHMPPHVYLNAVRIARAQQQIRRGQPLIDVALDCGFADQSHLTRRFKACVGVTPSQWQRALAARNPG